MRYRIPKAVLRANLEHEEVPLNTATCQYDLLNDSGRTVLVSLEAGETAEDAAASVATRTGAPLVQVRADVASFVQALVQRGLVEAER